MENLLEGMMYVCFRMLQIEGGYRNIFTYVTESKAQAPTKWEAWCTVNQKEFEKQSDLKLIARIFLSHREPGRT